MNWIYLFTVFIFIIIIFWKGAFCFPLLHLWFGFHVSLRSSMSLGYWNWDEDYGDDHTQDDGDDAEPASQATESPGPIHIPSLETVSGHNGVHQCDDADGPDGAEAGEDDQDEVIPGLRGLLHGGVPGGGAAQAGLGRGEGGGGGQLSGGARSHSHTVAVLVGLQALVAAHVDGEGGGHFHPITSGLRGHRQEFLRLLEVRRLSASSTLAQVGLQEVGVRVDGHVQLSVTAKKTRLSIFVQLI